MIVDDFKNIFSISSSSPVSVGFFNELFKSLSPGVVVLPNAAAKSGMSSLSSSGVGLFNVSEELSVIFLLWIFPYF